jgi:NTE family protein
MTEYNIGIVLSGGGARGFAHLGVLQALKEKGIEADVYSGVSAGAIISAFIADGKSPEETHKILKEYDLFEYSNIQLTTKGLFSLNQLKSKIKSYISANKIEELSKPVYIAVTNLNNGNIEYIKKGDLDIYLLASASIPIVFPPVEINNISYSDGGVIDNLPVSPLLGKCKKIIGVNISPITTVDKIGNLISIATRVFNIHVDSTMKDSIPACDIYIEPKGIEKYDLLKNSHADELFDLGYKSAKNIEI